MFWKNEKFFIRKAKKAIRIWREGGFVGVGHQIKFIYGRFQEKRNYQKWIRQFDTLTVKDREEIRHHIERFEYKPLISIILPVYNVGEKWLRLCLDSVAKQLYEKWELCIADDCSPSPHVRRVLEEYASRENRVKIVFRSRNGHISAASNSALETATGEFVALLDHDDELSEHALYFVAEELNRFPQTDMIYSDEDMIDEQGHRYAPKFKPDWSQELFYSLNLITHLSVYRTEILRRIGGFRLGVEGSQDYDLALRFIEQIPETHIRHIPRILYHWRAIKGSVALSSDEKPYAHERAREAISAYLERNGKKAKVCRTIYNLHRVSYELPQTLPKISVLTISDEENFLENILAKTDYRNFELLIGTSSRKSNCQNLSNKQRLRRIKFPSEATLASKFNKLAKDAAGEILVFLDGTFEIGHSDWLRELLGFAIQREIGAVGAKILNRGDFIRNSGIILGINGLFGFAHRDFPKETGGSFGRAQVVNNFSAVSGILAVRREVFAAAGGFDAEHFPNGLFDVDFCLRLREKNFRIVFTPYAELTQLSDSGTEKVLRDKKSESVEFFKSRWKHKIENDEFYNPNLSLGNEQFQIALVPRVKKPWLD